MYIVDFIKSLGRKSNIPTIIYLILNVFFIGIFICVAFSLPDWKGFLIGIGVYAISLTLALSPIGEFILRVQTRCKAFSISGMEEKVRPLFSEVYTLAREKDPSIRDDIALFYIDDECPNAFALGRKTVCLTKGMLQMPPEQIKAALGHEFGHLAHKDTDIILLISVGNLLVNIIVFGIRLVLELFFGVIMIFTTLLKILDFGLSELITKFARTITMAVTSLLLWLWTKIGVLLVMKSRRSNEYEADKFSYDLGYGRDLCLLLNNLGNVKAKGIFSNFVASHPKTGLRIEKLKQLENKEVLGNEY